MKFLKGFLVMMFLVMGITFLPQTSKAYTEGDLEYSVKKKQATITGVHTEGEKVVIPAEIGGFPVTKIGKYAFYGKKYVEVQLPDCVTEIGYEAFGDCSKLAKIKLPASLKKISRLSFDRCTKLKTVEFNKKLKEIGDFAFYNCITLKKVTLPKSLKEIGEGAFGKCFKLSSVTMGKKVKEIGDSAFMKCYQLKSITMPKSVSAIGDYVFKGCSDLENVKIRNSKVKMGVGTFYNCESLKSVKLPSKMKNIPELTFFNCKSLSKITMPKSVSFIKRKAFYGCQKLKKIKLTEKMYAIGDKAFAYSGLKALKLNQKMEFIGNGAFTATKIRTLTLPSKVTFIGNRVFADCKKLKKISIPASVKGINMGAFNNCVSLQEINVASGNKKYASRDGVLYNEEMTKLIQYPIDKKNKNFSLPSSVKEIRAHAFEENENLENVTVYAEKIGNYAFAYMDLKSVVIKGSTSRIGTGAFCANNSLKKVTLPNSVKSIGDYAFSNTKISTFRIPTSLSSMSRNALEGCKKIKAFEGTTSPRFKVEDGVLYKKDMKELVLYPAKKSDKKFVVPDSVEQVGNYAFVHANNLRKIEFGTGFRRFKGSYGISECDNLKSVVFNCLKISSSTWYGIRDCQKLAVVVGPNSYAMSRIAYYADATLISL